MSVPVMGERSASNDAIVFGQGESIRPRIVMFDGLKAPQVVSHIRLELPKSPGIPEASITRHQLRVVG
jgi:hypothetical protein